MYSLSKKKTKFQFKSKLSTTLSWLNREAISEKYPNNLKVINTQQAQHSDAFCSIFVCKGRNINGIFMQNVY